MPSYEVRVSLTYYQYYDLAWEACYRQLYRSAIIYVERTNTHILIRLGCGFTIYKLTP